MNGIPNVFSLLDALLADLLPPRGRRIIHTLIFLSLAILAVVTFYEGDWEEALVAVAVAAYASMNKANTPALPAATEAGEDYPEDDYLEAEAEAEADSGSPIG